MAVSIDSRPVRARWPGQKPRLPTITPNVIYLFSFRAVSLRAEAECVGCAEDDEEGSPPDTGVELRKNYGVFRWVEKVVDAGSEDDDSVGEEERADEEPDGEHAGS